MSLDLDKLRALFNLLAEKDVAEFEHEEDGTRLRIARGARVSLSATAPAVLTSSPIAHSIAPGTSPAGDGSTRPLRAVTSST